MPPSASVSTACSASSSLLSTSSKHILQSRPGRLRCISTRLIHTTNRSSTSAPVGPAGIVPPPPREPRSPHDKQAAAPLSLLPLTNVLRSFATTTISSSPTLLPVSLAAMKVLASSSSPILNPDKNPLLRFFLKKTFYAQFCAGENKPEVTATINGLKNIGYTGVILAYAKEVVLKDSDKKNLASCNSPDGQAANKKEVSAWAEGTLETVRLASPGDFVALKFTGSGRQTLYNLTERLPPSPLLEHYIDSICQLAVARNVRLLFDAEQNAVQAGIDDLTLQFMAKYNTPGRAVVYGTYQTYLKAAPQVLGEHLRAAQKNNFALGVKLVRGAYIGSDPRHLIHDTKADTDAAFDGIAEALLRREWTAPLETSDQPFPAVGLVLASHNADSVRRAQEVMKSGAAKTTDVAFAQLQGMADEVSCEIVSNMKASGNADNVQAYKYLVWGSAGECMKYLLRRAHENRDAVKRTKDGQVAMGKELLRRIGLRS